MPSCVKLFVWLICQPKAQGDKESWGNYMNQLTQRQFPRPSSFLQLYHCFYCLSLPSHNRSQQLSPPVPWLHAHQKDSKCRVLHVILTVHLLFIFVLFSRKITYIYRNSPRAEWVCWRRHLSSASALVLPGQIVSSDNGGKHLIFQEQAEL